MKAMYRKIGLVLLGGVLFSSCKTVGSGGSSSLLEGCYDPLSGHPTSAEKIAFFKEVSAYAQEAERLHGVPAAGLLAMAAPEGGYGFTKTARNAKNLFGWKYNGKESSGNRPYYTLSCQPSWDPNNKYIKFNDFREGVIFIASKLATLKDLGGGKRNYKKHTDRYIQDRKNGVDVKTAVNRWIDGIADAGYNYQPATYKKKVKNFAANVTTGKGDWSEQYNSYQLSSAAMPLSGPEKPKPAPQPQPQPKPNPAPTPTPPPTPTPTPTPPPVVQRGFDVEGVVHMMGDEDNRLGNAYIHIKDKVLTTQETGYFIIENLLPGTYEMTVKMEGFNDRVVSVTVKDANVEVLVGLSPK